MTSGIPVKKEPALIKVKTDALGALEPRIPVPLYDRARLKCGIAHMSIGGFHRSHQAVYLDDLMAEDPGDWMICGIGLLPQDSGNIKAMQDQDGLYSVLERSAREDKVRIIGTIKELHHAPSSPQAVLKRLCDPDIKILSLTITEKGYCYDKNQELDESHPAIQHDLKNPNSPQTGIGYAVYALQQRRKQNLPPFTVMSCDNLPGNGHVTHRILTSFARLADRDLAAWIDDHVRFPNAMVDRITPVTTDAVRQTLRENFGIDDQWPVVCEDFRQWVLEDDFSQGRPHLERVGVQIVKDVEPYEKMKVRLLNGSHSALSYLSYLAGYRDVDAAMADPLISGFVRRYMDNDITPTLPPVPGIDLNGYKDTLITRFSNPAIRDQVLRLAEDGSQKIKNAIVPCLEYQLETEGSIRFAALALAGWFRFLTGTDEKSQPIPVKDPIAATLQARARVEPRNPMHLLGIQEIFGPRLSASERLRREVTAALESLYFKGTEATLELWK